MRWIKIFDSLDKAETRVSIDTPILLEIGKRKLVLIRRKTGWFAADNACPHQNESLSGGWLNSENEIICPLHEYRFSLHSGRECRGRTSDLQTYPVKAENGLFIGLTS
jgi:nitrite reductase/ring-hydroxylating ferredoxin subunit